MQMEMELSSLAKTHRFSPFISKAFIVPREMTVKKRRDSLFTKNNSKILFYLYRAIQKSQVESTAKTINKQKHQNIAALKTHHTAVVSGLSRILFLSDNSIIQA